MTVFELAAKLTLDSSEYEKGLKGSAKSANEFAKKLDAGVNKLIKIGTVAAGAASAALIAFGKDAVQTGMRFDAAMSQVAATMGMTNDEITDLRDFAKQMGAQTKYSATEAADALNYMALAGYDADTSMAMLPGVLNLAAAGNMDLARASDMVTDSQSALGLSLDETTDLVDKMAQASSKSNTSVEQLGDAILTVGGTAKNLSGGTTELATALGILADNGVKGAEGGTALRNIILSLSAPTDIAAKKLKSLGVSVYDDTGHMRSLNEIFGDLDTSMADLTQEQRMEALSTIFNNRDLKSAEALLANYGDRWDELSGYIDNSAGAAQKMADTQLDNLNGDLTIMNSALEGAKIAFSDGITPSLRRIVQMVTRALSNPKTTKFLNETGQKIGELAEKLAEWTSNALPKVISLFSNGAPKVKAFGIALAGIVIAVKAVTNPVGALVTGLGLLGGAFAIAKLGAEEYVPKLTAVQQAHQETADAVNESISRYEELKKARGEAVNSAYDEYDSTMALWQELQTIVDANGKVKEGYEERAEYIANKLSSDTGQAIEIVDGEVKKWGELNAEIERSILLKRGEALIAANQPMYQEALGALGEIDERISQLETEKARAWEAAHAELVQAVDAAGGLEAYASQQAGVIAGNYERYGIGENYEQAYQNVLNNASQMYYATEPPNLFSGGGALIQQREEYLEIIQKQEEAERLLAEGSIESLSQIENALSRDLGKRWAYLREKETISDDELSLLNDDLETAKRTRDRYMEEWKKDWSNKFLADKVKQYSEQVKELEGILEEVNSDASEQGASAGATFSQKLAAAITGNIGLISGAVNTVKGVLANITAGLTFTGDGWHNVASSTSSNRHAIGLDYVPYNDYPAMLHHGEAVLTENEADDWRRGHSGRGQVVNNFTFNGVSRSDLDMIVGVVNRELGFA